MICAPFEKVYGGELQGSMEHYWDSLELSIGALSLFLYEQQMYENKYKLDG
jgi:hypothetical protein